MNRTDPLGNNIVRPPAPPSRRMLRPSSGPVVHVPATPSGGVRCINDIVNDFFRRREAQALSATYPQTFRPLSGRVTPHEDRNINDIVDDFFRSSEREIAQVSLSRRPLPRSSSGPVVHVPTTPSDGLRCINDIVNDFFRYREAQGLSATHPQTFRSLSERVTPHEGRSSNDSVEDFFRSSGREAAQVPLSHRRHKSLPPLLPVTTPPTRILSPIRSPLRAFPVVSFEIPDADLAVAKRTHTQSKGLRSPTF